MSELTRDDLYQHALQYVARSMTEDQAEAYAVWFADFYSDDPDCADHGSATAVQARVDVIERDRAEDAAVERGNWFDALCADHGLTALPKITADEIRKGVYLFTVTGDPRQVASVKRTSRHTSVVFADGGRDSFANAREISFVATGA